MPVVSNQSGSSSAPFFQPSGLRGDGSDDTSRIQAAIDRARDAGGGSVVLPQGVFTHTGLTIYTGVWLVGQSHWGTELKLASGSNTHSIKTFVSTGADVQNTYFAGVSRLKVNGNNAQNSSGHGIYISRDPLTAFENNPVWEVPNTVVDQVVLYRCANDGYNAEGVSGNVVSNVIEIQSGRYGFNPSFDTIISHSQSQKAGVVGFKLQYSNQAVSGCKAYGTGWPWAVLDRGSGFEISTPGGGTSLVGCIAQDCGASGFYFASAKSCTGSGLIADSNSRCASGNSAGFFLNDASFNVIHGTAFDRFEASMDMQKSALALGGNSLNNDVTLTHSAYNGSSIGTNVQRWDSGCLGNRVLINGVTRTESVAYASAIDPPTRKAPLIVVGTLTGPITINAPESAYTGTILTFVFTQDAVGGHTVTWNAIYKVLAGAVSTTANKKSVVSFVFDGTNWVQSSSAAGI